MSNEGALASAAGRVCDAIRRHAETCQEEPENVGAVIRDGEALSKAVLEYEAVLRATSGWSNPIRHLGPLPLFDEAQLGDSTSDAGVTSSPTSEESALAKIEIGARYSLHTYNENALLAFVGGRFAMEVSDVKEAINMLYKAESWDPLRYPPALMNVDRVEVKISVDRA